MNINSLSNEEILKLILTNNNQYYTKDNIVAELEKYQYFYDLSLEKILSCLETLNFSDLFINIDDFYEKNFDVKKVKKMSSREIIRYIVRNTNKDSEYGNFHKIEYKYIKSIIMNEFMKMHLSNKIISECLIYLDEHLEELFDSDRYIINPAKLNHKLDDKTKVIYDFVSYKLKNVYIVYNQNNIYYCIRRLCNKNGEIEIYGNISKNKYYRTIIYDYYDIKTQDFICQNDQGSYNIESLYDLYDLSCSKSKDCVISLYKIEQMIELPILQFDKPKIRQINI